MLAAESAFEAITKEGNEDKKGFVLDSYEEGYKKSWIQKELHGVRNIRPGFEKWGLYGGSLYAGIDALILRGKAPWTFRHSKPDYLCLKPAADWFLFFLFFFRNDYSFFFLK